MNIYKIKMKEKGQPRPQTVRQRQGNGQYLGHKSSNSFYSNSQKYKTLLESEALFGHKIIYSDMGETGLKKPSSLNLSAWNIGRVKSTGEMHSNNNNNNNSINSCRRKDSWEAKSYARCKGRASSAMGRGNGEDGRRERSRMSSINNLELGTKGGNVSVFSFGGNDSRSIWGSKTHYPKEPQISRHTRYSDNIETEDGVLKTEKQKKPKEKTKTTIYITQIQFETPKDIFANLSQFSSLEETRNNNKECKELIPEEVELKAWGEEMETEEKQSSVSFCMGSNQRTCTEQIELPESPKSNLEETGRGNPSFEGQLGTIIMRGDTKKDGSGSGISGISSKGNTNTNTNTLTPPPRSKIISIQHPPVTPTKLKITTLGLKQPGHSMRHKRASHNSPTNTNTIPNKTPRKIINSSINRTFFLNSKLKSQKDIGVPQYNMGSGSNGSDRAYNPPTIKSRSTSPIVNQGQGHGQGSHKRNEIMKLRYPKTPRVIKNALSNGSKIYNKEIEYPLDKVSEFLLIPQLKREDMQRRSFVKEYERLLNFQISNLGGHVENNVVNSERCSSNIKGEFNMKRRKYECKGGRELRTIDTGRKDNKDYKDYKDNKDTKDNMSSIGYNAAVWDSSPLQRGKASVPMERSNHHIRGSSCTSSGHRKGGARGGSRKILGVGNKRRSAHALAFSFPNIGMGDNYPNAGYPLTDYNYSAVHKSRLHHPFIPNNIHSDPNFHGICDPHTSNKAVERIRSKLIHDLESLRKTALSTTNAMNPKLKLMNYAPWKHSIIY